MPADTVLQNLILISVGLSLCFVSPAFSLAYSRLELAASARAPAPLAPRRSDMRPSG